MTKADQKVAEATASDKPPTDGAGDGAAEEAKLALEQAERDAEDARAKAAAQAATETVLQRRKLGRGNQRRIVRARDALDAALTAFCKDMDLEVYHVDDQGFRTGPWPMLATLGQVKQAVIEEVNKILAPAT